MNKEAVAHSRYLTYYSDLGDWLYASRPALVRIQQVVDRYETFSTLSPTVTAVVVAVSYYGHSSCICYCCCCPLPQPLFFISVILSTLLLHANQ